MTWVAVGGAVVSIVGGIAGAQGSKASASMTRQIQAKNSKAIEAQAVAALKQTDDDIVILRQQLARVVGDQRAAWGASGLSGDSGSALDVLAASVTAGIQDQQRRRAAGQQQAADLRRAAEIGDLSAAAMIQQYNAQGQQSMIQGVAGAAQSLSKFAAKPAAKPAANPAIVGPYS